VDINDTEILVSGCYVHIKRRITQHTNNKKVRYHPRKGTVLAGVSVTQECHAHPR